jgi:hypothetical protein
MWPWLAALVAIVAILMLAIGYAHILAILLDQVEGIEDRFMRGLSSAQILKAARDKPSTLKGSGPTIGRGPSAGEGAAAWDDASRAVVNAE